MALSTTENNAYCTIHQFFDVLDDMDQNNETTNNTEMQCVRQQIYINLENWTQAMSQNQQRNQRIYRQKVMFFIMRFVELLQTTYHWEYIQEYFPFFEDAWYELPNWTPNSPDDTQNTIQYDLYFYIKRLQKRQIELRKMINSLIILFCCILVAIFAAIFFFS